MKSKLDRRFNFISSYLNLSYGGFDSISINRLEDGVRVTGNSGPEIGALLGSRASDGRTLHFTLVVHNNTSVVLEIDESALLASPGLSLANDHGRVNLLSQLGLALLAGSHDKVANGGGRELVKSTLDAIYGNNLKRLSTRVIRAVHHSADGKT